MPSDVDQMAFMNILAAAQPSDPRCGSVVFPCFPSCRFGCRSRMLLNRLRKNRDQDDLKNVFRRRRHNSMQNQQHALRERRSQHGKCGRSTKAVEDRPYTPAHNRSGADVNFLIYCVHVRTRKSAGESPLILGAFRRCEVFGFSRGRSILYYVSTFASGRAGAAWRKCKRTGCR